MNPTELPNQAFEKLVFCLQDSTGFEETIELHQTSLHECQQQLANPYLKEIHLINPLWKS